MKQRESRVSINATSNVCQHWYILGFVAEHWPLLPLAVLNVTSGVPNVTVTAFYSVNCVDISSTANGFCDWISTTCWWRSSVVRTSVFGQLTFSALHQSMVDRGDHFVGKLSAVSQPTRPTQPSILPLSLPFFWELADE